MKEQCQDYTLVPICALPSLYTYTHIGTHTNEYEYIDAPRHLYTYRHRVPICVGYALIQLESLAFAMLSHTLPLTLALAPSPGLIGTHEVCCRCVASVLQVCCKCVVSVLQVCCKCAVFVQSVLQCVASVWHACCLCAECIAVCCCKVRCNV